MTDLELALAEVTGRVRHGKVMICEGQGDLSGGDGCGGQGGTGQAICACCFGVGLMTPQLQDVIEAGRQRQATLVAHAESELASLPGRRTNYRIMLERDVVALVALFEAQRHSGSSARFIMDALDRLLRWKSLNPSDPA